jgi:hypothetical protein
MGKSCRTRSDIGSERVKEIRRYLKLTEEALDHPLWELTLEETMDLL